MKRKLSIRSAIILLMMLVTLATALRRDFNIYIQLIAAAGILILLPNRGKLDSLVLLLGIFSLLYGLFIWGNGLIDSYANLLGYILAPIVFYKFGEYVWWKYNVSNSRVMLILLTLAAYLIPLYAMTIDGILSMGSFVNKERILDVDNDANNLSATLYGLHLSLGLGCVGLCFDSRTSWLSRIISLIFFICSLLTTVFLVNRTGIVIAAVVLVVTYLYYSKGSILSILRGLVFIFFFWFIISRMGLLDERVLDAYMNREQDGYDVGSAGGRAGMWLSSIESLFKYPLGFNGVVVKYAHNLWLDIARVVGILPLIPFFFATIHMIKISVRIFFKTNDAEGGLLIGLFVASFLNAFVEPVIEASLLYFSLMMMIWGMISAYYLNWRNIASKHPTENLIIVNRRLY